MQRQFIVAVAVLSLTASAAAISLRPEITGVVPDSPAPSRTTQSIVVSGREFAPGLSLSPSNETSSASSGRRSNRIFVRENGFGMFASVFVRI